MLVPPQTLLLTVLISSVAMAADTGLAAVAVGAEPVELTVAANEQDTADQPTRSAALRRGETVLPATVSPVSPRSDLAIFSGVQKSEVGSSVTSVLDAARRCVEQGVSYYRAQPRPTRTPYVGVRQIGERRVRLERRMAVYSCKAHPVSRCSFVYVWDDEVPEIGYASIQCTGSYDSRDDMYLVTAQRDLGSWRVRSMDRSEQAASLSFQTTEFPGTHMIAYGSMRRSDGKVTRPVEMSIFDDYKSFDEDVSQTVQAREVDALARSVLQLACAAVGDCAPAD